MLWTACAVIVPAVLIYSVVHLIDRRRIALRLALGIALAVAIAAACSRR